MVSAKGGKCKSFSIFLVVMFLANGIIGVSGVSATTSDVTFQLELISAENGPEKMVPALIQVLGKSSDESLAVFNSLPATLFEDVSKDKVLIAAAVLIEAGGEVRILPTPCLRNVDYSVKLISYGPAKSDVIQELGEQLTVSKPVARALVESAPAVVAEQLTKDEAKVLVKALDKKGAEVEFQVHSECVGAQKVVDLTDNPASHYAEITVLAFENKSKTRKMIYQHVDLSMQEIQVLLRELPATLPVTIDKQLAHSLAVKLQGIGTEVKVRKIN